MAAALIGIVFVIVAVVLWLGHLTVAHAIAIEVGLLGILLILYWALPATAYARRWQ
jgi:hypothetical protein